MLVCGIFFVKENIEVMKSYGVEISLRTLKRWKDKNGLTKERKKVQSKTYEEEKRTSYNLNCTFSNNIEQNKTDMEANKNVIRALNGGVEEMPIDEETNQQGENNWVFRLVKYPIFAMVFDCK